MEWIKKETRLPDEEKDGTRVETFSPIYPKDSEMRHRIMNAQFVRICSEVTYWRKLDEPSEGNNVDASECNCTIHRVSQQREQLAILALERISKAHSESFSAGVASEALYKIAITFPV